MSRIDELIQEFCPEGVGSKLLGEVCTIKTGQPVSKVLISKNPGEYPVINSGREPLGFIDKFNTEDDPIGITSRGAGVGSVTWCPGKYYRGNLNYSVTIKDKRLLDVRFLYFLLMQNQPDIQRLATYQGIPALNKSNLEKLQIPIPPLEVQKEIVSILDKFTQLETELSTELDARRKQYEYYRNQMLTFDASRKDVELMSLKELSEDTFWIMPATPQFIADGNVPYITSKNIRGGHIDFSNIKRISRASYESISRNRPIVEDDILISMIGTIGEVARVKSNDLDFYGQNMYLLRLNQKLINVSYFLHFFDSAKMKRYFDSVKNNSGQGYLKAGQVESITLPVPPLEEQNRIVSVLDKFDTLNNDISVGLPAEINARRKQYEYYRTKLLAFQEIPV